MAEHLIRLLEPRHQVEVVSDGAALLAAATRDLPDVIITDVTMPVMSGLAAAGKILAIHPHARIILATVRNEAAIIEQALSDGVQGYVTKTDAGDELIEAVRTVLNGGRYISSSAQATLANRSRGA